MTRSLPVLIASDGTRYPLSKDGLHTIGSENCAILLHDASVLPHHASVVVARLRVNLRAESGAVYLNGKRITGMVSLNEGDVIKLGEVTLILTIQQAEALSPPPAPAKPFMPLRMEDAFPPINPIFDEHPGFGIDEKTAQTAPPPAPTPPPQPAPIAPPALEEQSAEPEFLAPSSEEEASGDAALEETSIMPDGYSDEVSLDLDDETVCADSIPRDGLPQERSRDDFTTGDAPEKKAKPAPGATNGAEVHFAAYYPREVSTEHKSAGLYVYAYLESALSAIQRDIEKFEAELGGSIPRPRTAEQAARLKPDSRLTVMIDCPDLEFAQTSISKKWREPFIRFDFEFYPPTALPKGRSYVAIAQVIVLVEGIEIARIANCAIEIISASGTIDDTEAAASGQPLTVDLRISNPLAQAKFERQVARMYQRIFVSYSRKDLEVVELYRKAQIALGNEVFKDTESIRAGEDWQAALARFIDEADIFQLFWSQHSAASDHVRDEWEYALEYRCEGAEDECEGFIRPVYWEQPMPPVPAKLNHLNFRYVQFE